MLFNMVYCRSYMPSVAMWTFELGVLVFVVRPDQVDQEEIVIIVALEFKVQLGIKEESERYVVFTRMNLFLEEMYNT